MLFPNGVNYLETYNASEGFGIKDEPNKEDMLDARLWRF